jgi:hypothetical protein
MNSQGHLDDRTLRRYLLGDILSPEEQECIEGSFFESDECVDHLAEVEDDLIDEYIRGELDPVDRGRFEGHFLASSRRRGRYEVMRTLATGFFRDSSRPHRSFLGRLWQFLRTQPRTARLATSGAATAIIVGFCLVSADDLRLRNATVRDAGLPPASEIASSQRGVFQLKAGLSRSGSDLENRISVDPRTEWVTLRLQTSAAGYSSFIATLKSAAGDEIARESQLRLSGNAIDFTLSAAELRPGEDYSVALAGVSSSGVPAALPSYAFHVAK